MKEFFTKEQIENELNKVFIEDDDVVLTCEYIEGEGKNYVFSGSALIDEEVYNDFKVEVELLEAPEEETIENIMPLEWDWYDYLC